MLHDHSDIIVHDAYLVNRSHLYFTIFALQFSYQAVALPKFILFFPMIINDILVADSVVSWKFDFPFNNEGVVFLNDCVERGLEFINVDSLLFFKHFC